VAAPAFGPVALVGVRVIVAVVLLLPLVKQWSEFRKSVRPLFVPDPKEWVCALLLRLVCTGAAYMLYFRLLKNIGVARATTVTFLIPVFGIAWGALLLHEPVTWALIASCLLVVLGTALAVGLLRLPPRTADAVC
jgi:drug/metabolite transporter (DMT)-like permease